MGDVLSSQASSARLSSTIGLWRWKRRLPDWSDEFVHHLPRAFAQRVALAFALVELNGDASAGGDPRDVQDPPMGVQGRDWWRERYDDLHGRKERYVPSPRQRLLRPLREQSREQGDSDASKVATRVVLALGVLSMCVRKAHLLP